MILSEKEIWKDIINYEGYYQISDLGRVRSVDRWVKNSGNYSEGFLKKGFVKKLIIDSKGYLRTRFCKNGICNGEKVHRLVALHFIPNPNNLPQVNHKDGNKCNNCVDNLEWCTNDENMAHAWRLGLKNANHVKGEKSHTAKVSEQTVLEIRRLFSSNIMSRKQIRESLNLSRDIVNDIIRRITWKHI